jgi:hypothetical protein
MKKRGRILTLRGFVTVFSEGSVSVGGNYANRIFSDERIGYGWKVIDFQLMPPATGITTRGEAVGLWTINPERLGTAQLLKMISTTASSVNNQCIGLIRNPFNSKDNTVIDPQHVIVDTLTVVAPDDDSVPYIITIEEYEINDYEEIVQRIKEVAQNIEDAA